MNNNIIKKVQGKIIKEHSAKKDGKIIHHVFDLYCQINDELFYIKKYSSSISKDELIGHSEHEQILYLEVSFHEGNWDASDDDRMTQSRFGKYIIIHNILNLNSP